MRQILSNRVGKDLDDEQPQVRAQTAAALPLPVGQ